MVEIAQSIELNLAEKLQDKEYRQKFFLAEASADIAKQLIALRKRRGLDQGQLASLVGTQQPAISRIEKADYQNWSFNTLRKIAAAEDARIRVTIQPAEDVLKQYETQSEAVPVVTYNYEALFDAFRIQNAVSARQFFPVAKSSGPVDVIADPACSSGHFFSGRYTLYRRVIPTMSGGQIDDKDRVISDLKAENARLREKLAEARAWQGWAPQQAAATNGIPAL